MSFEFLSGHGPACRHCGVPPYGIGARGAGLSLALMLSLVPGAGRAADTSAYRKPPSAVLDVLHAPLTPDVLLSPTRDILLLIDRQGYPAIAEVARPMLGLGGIRINPANNGPHRSPPYTGVSLQPLTGGEPRRLRLPTDARIDLPAWAPDGKRFAFALHQPDRIELWVAEAATAQARRLTGIILNDTLGAAFQWMPDSRALLCRVIPSERGPAPAPPAAPSGPNIQESFGKPAPARTHQDLLQNPHDDALFEHYCTSQLALVDSVEGTRTGLGKPGIFGLAHPSPDGRLLLVTTLSKPFPRFLAVSGFAREVEVWDRSGRRAHHVASLPSHEGVPIEGVPTGPRQFRWRATADATLTWVEALDGGNPKTKAPHRDRLMALAAPFDAPPRELLRLEHRFSGLTWGEEDGMALTSEYDRDRRWTRTWLAYFDRPGVAARVLWDRSVRDRYRDPGAPLMRVKSNGERVIWQKGSTIFLAGAGASASGDFPFLDACELPSGKAERMFQCAPDAYETIVAIVADGTGPKPGLQFVTRRETPSRPPNYFLRAGSSERPLTQFADSTPQLRGISRQLVTYKREDGVPLSFTLYLPAGYQPGTRLPTVVWAYPLEYNDPDTAGQVSGSTNRFVTIRGASHLFFLTQGYAVLDGATMPIVGPPETMNDTFIEQIIRSAKAAIDKAVELGVTDPERVGVGGHSYGAFMTANLLAHSRLFRAGIARSGAYNRTLTPFGFQGERRTYWEAPETYNRMSPFMRAQDIRDPILLIHGEADDNDGTFPIQSQRLFQAIKGNGGNVRYVTLPHESHGYAAAESIEHVLHEMISWFDAHVKNAPPRNTVLQ